LEASNPTAKKRRGEDGEEGDAARDAEGQANQRIRKEERIKTERERISKLPVVVLEVAERIGMPPPMLLRAAKLVGDSPLGKRVK
jgi:hypothetical protein